MFGSILKLCFIATLFLTAAASASVKDTFTDTENAVHTELLRAGVETCPVGYDVELHTEDPNFGDICRATGQGPHGTWHVPHGCVSIGSVAPFTTTSAGQPCRFPPGVAEVVKWVTNEKAAERNRAANGKAQNKQADDHKTDGKAEIVKRVTKEKATERNRAANGKAQNKQADDHKTDGKDHDPYTFDSGVVEMTSMRGAQSGTKIPGGGIAIVFACALVVGLGALVFTVQRKKTEASTLQRIEHQDFIQE